MKNRLKHQQWDCWVLLMETNNKACDWPHNPSWPCPTSGILVLNSFHKNDLVIIITALWGQGVTRCACDQKVSTIYA